ncbi:2OG-Fe(II) oxygenase [Sphingomonas sp. URHD0057]|uniref:2OG-Fe(II) oxygenase n=1 Tax=Sphingomonas sp. URHD0057 TaxID=1380389 RepID=UPI00048DEE49|nr:2OG-Fe(II) oxygenase [Sphingomonas sp. URHD0057]
MDGDHQFRFGMELLIDPTDAGGWRRAVELIEAAARDGHGEAAERCALFEFMGVGRRVDLAKALHWLAKAAELGSRSAAQQLIILADDRFVTAEEAQAGTSWSDLASRIAIDRRLRPPPGRELSGKPLIRAFDRFASPAECEWLIDRAGRRLAPASVRDPNSGEAVADPVRNNRSAAFDFADLDLIVEMIRVRLALAIGAAPPFLEASQVLHYSVGQEFKPHHDYLDPASSLAAEIARNGQRAATVLIYLNEDFEGGETRFPAIGFDYRGKTGDMLMFSNLDPAGRPEPASLHAGLPPTRGEKWIFSQWVRDRPIGA